MTGGDGGGPGHAVREFVAPAAAVPLDATLAAALRALRERGREALPVSDEGGGGAIVGVVTRAELAAAAPRRRRGRVRLRDLVRLRVVYCFADSDVADAAATMRAAGASHLAVLGEDVRFLGLLARGDLPPAAVAAA